MKTFIILQKRLIECGKSKYTIEALKKIAENYLTKDEIAEIFGE